MKPIVLLCMFALLLISSCTIQKRIYQPGWHIEWRKNYKGTESVKEDKSKVNSRTNTESIKDDLFAEFSTVNSVVTKNVSESFYSSASVNDTEEVSQPEEEIFNNDTETRKSEDRTEPVGKDTPHTEQENDTANNGLVAVLTITMLLSLSAAIFTVAFNWFGVGASGLMFMFFLVLTLIQVLILNSLNTKNKKFSWKKGADGNSKEETIPSPEDDLRKAKLKKREKFALGGMFLSIFILILLISKIG